MATTNTCPCCPRGCDLSAPHCARGEAYAKTGVIPQRNEGHEGHEGHHAHGERLKFANDAQQQVMKNLHHAAMASRHGGFTQDMAEQMFSVLTVEETATLASLLQKLADHWMTIAPEKPHHHHHG